MHKDRTIVFAVCAIIALGALLFVLAPLTRRLHIDQEIPRSNSKTVEIRGDTIQVDIADTDTLREKGLGGRDSLSKGQGMLFVFPNDGVYKFWMKDMKFSIDILWVDGNDRIIYIADSLAPQSYPHSYGPEILARYVLELPAGYASRHQIRVGDRVQI